MWNLNKLEVYIWLVKLVGIYIFQKYYLKINFNCYALRVSQSNAYICKTLKIVGDWVKHFADMAIYDWISM